MDENILRAFIVSAKRQTYASGKRKTASKIPGSKEFHFRQDSMEYIDIYFGNVTFNGVETVFKDNVPVWGMVYSGGIIDEASDVDGLYSFLKKCLYLVSEEAPFRGPESYAEKVYEYYNDFSGDISHFIGYEKIESDEETLYELHYSGGEIL